MKIIKILSLATLAITCSVQGMMRQREQTERPFIIPPAIVDAAELAQTMEEALPGLNLIRERNLMEMEENTAHMDRNNERMERIEAESRAREQEVAALRVLEQSAQRSYRWSMAIAVVVIVVVAATAAGIAVYFDAENKKNLRKAHE